MGKVKDHAQSIFERIGEGHANAIKRPWNTAVDRALRELIEQANQNGDCIIPRENGDGYYRPIPSDPVDSNEFNIYIKKEASRVKSITLKEMSMRVAYESRS